MLPDTRKHLIEILAAAADIKAFILGYDLGSYRNDAKAELRLNANWKSSVKHAHESAMRIRMPSIICHTAIRSLVYATA